MLDILVFVVCSIFVAISATHVYWAFGGRKGSAAAVPSTNGVAAFKPSRTATLIVALLLMLAAVSVILSRVDLNTGFQPWVTSIPATLVALILAARAVGDFHSVGFFKKPSSSPFARLDTRYFSPLCAALSASIVVILLFD
jgi:hypothetical protein